LRQIFRPRSAISLVDGEISTNLSECRSRASARVSPSAARSFFSFPSSKGTAKGAGLRAVTVRGHDFAGSRSFRADVKLFMPFSRIIFLAFSKLSVLNERTDNLPERLATK
jgi:hypothetical protein